MTDLSDRVAVVTGAAGNLGRAIAARLAAAGMRLVLLDRAAIPSEMPGLAFGGLDLTDAAAVRGALDDAQQQLGRIDGLVTTVGGFEGGPAVHEGDWAAWERMLAMNLKTAVTACQAAIPHLLVHGGSIVTVGARPGLAGVAGLAPYAASKAAVIRMTESIAQELRDRGVTANCIAPSIIDTPPNRAAMPDADHTRWVPPEDLAEVVLFLLSPAARSISGATIPVYGRS